MTGWSGLIFMHNVSNSRPPSGPVNLEKSEPIPKQVFDFVGYQYDLVEGKVRPTQERWEALRDKVLRLMAVQTCRV